MTKQYFLTKPASRNDQKQFDSIALINYQSVLNMHLTTLNQQTRESESGEKMFSMKTNIQISVSIFSFIPPFKVRRTGIRVPSIKIMFQVVQNNVQQNSAFNEPPDVWTAPAQNEDIKPQTFLCYFKLETGGLY